MFSSVVTIKCFQVCACLPVTVIIVSTPCRTGAGETPVKVTKGMWKCKIQICLMLSFSPGFKGKM